MKRELKFRVWNIQDKRWENPNILEVWDDSGKLEPYQYIKTGTLDPVYMPIENYIIHQYTGYKDMNGKEIYEDDFVKIKTIRNEYIVQVAWGGMQLCIDGQLEVIGNIFNTPNIKTEEGAV